MCICVRVYECMCTCACVFPTLPSFHVSVLSLLLIICDDMLDTKQQRMRVNRAVSTTEIGLIANNSKQLVK